VIIRRVENLKAGDRVRHLARVYTVAHPARFLANDKQGRGYLVLEHAPDCAEAVTVYRGEGWFTVEKGEA
jgi:hypothetical protein